MSASFPVRPIRMGQRTAQFQESVIREMTRLAEEIGALNLSQGLPDLPTPPAVATAPHPGARGAARLTADRRSPHMAPEQGCSGAFVCE